MDNQTHLEKIIENLGNRFENDELAYLALTSKVENVLRDKIAFDFHKLYRNQKLVCREWTNQKETKLRADLAILNLNAEPELIIEFKAHSSIVGIGEWSKSLSDDYYKNKSRHNNVDIIFVLFANYIDQMPGNKLYMNSIKYYENLQKSQSRNYTIENQNEDWKKALKKKEIKCDIYNYIIFAGKFENSNVIINTFIHKNIKI
jgi:hypothetical protein